MHNVSFKQHELPCYTPTLELDNQRDFSIKFSNFTDQVRTMSEKYTRQHSAFYKGLKMRISRFQCYKLCHYAATLKLDSWYDFETKYFQICRLHRSAIIYQRKKKAFWKNFVDFQTSKRAELSLLGFWNGPRWSTPPVDSTYITHLLRSPKARAIF